MDGLKTSLRKILFCAFKKRLQTEIKVAQFSGYVSEHSCYHHGEESLNQAIVGMAQNFVGSNNINLLVPAGQFGSRIKGGKDASSPRYIFTHLERITRLLFPEQDDHILKYLDDDGTPVEPQFYVPIIPMILVNGSKGIGTGFSTEIMCYNPKVIIEYLKNVLQKNTEANKSINFVPYYEGFTGTIIKINDTQYFFKGVYERISQDIIRVTELPVGYWTEDFKELLEELLNDKDKDGNKITPMIKHYDDNSKDTTVDFVITFAKGKIDELEQMNSQTSAEYTFNGLEKLLKLGKMGSTTNMNLFDYEDKLKKYETVEDIIDAFYAIRISYYSERKEFMIRALEKELLVLTNKARYIQELLDGTIDLRKKKKSEIIDMLGGKQYDLIEGDDEYKYLTRMPMDSVSEENVEKINKEHKDKHDELMRIKETTVEQMWLSELDILENEYQLYQQERIQSQMGEVGTKKKSGNKIVAKVGGAKKTVKKMAPELVVEETIQVVTKTKSKK
jgi:DNA topoisomerase-2